ncbi:helix-turn-helix transcriptional regulator [Luteimonas fraxinea]
MKADGCQKNETTTHSPAPISQATRPICDYRKCFARMESAESDAVSSRCRRMPAALPTPTVVGKRLRMARLARELTQAQLGERLGLDDPNTAAPRISRYERGMHEPDLITLEKLAEALELPVAYFYTSSDLLAEVILVISRLPRKRQAEALAMLKAFADKL